MLVTPATERTNVLSAVLLAMLRLKTSSTGLSYEARAPQVIDFPTSCIGGCTACILMHRCGDKYLLTSRLHRTGPSSYELPPLATTKIRTKGGKGSREARLKPIYTTSASSPGPGAYFKESVSEIQNEISMRRTASRDSVATSRSRASLGREKSQDMPPYTGRRTYLDEVQNNSAKTPGPGVFRSICVQIVSQFDLNLHAQATSVDYAQPCN